MHVKEDQYGHLGRLVFMHEIKHMVLRHFPKHSYCLLTYPSQEGGNQECHTWSACG